MAIFRIENLKVDTVIGVYEWERDLPQRLLVSIEIETNVTEPAASDDVSHTVDYDALTRDIREWGERQTFQLIEAFAIAMLKRIVQRDGIERASVTVAKPGALKDAESVQVTVCSDEDLDS